jgi:peptide/nickel transport system substrate-binding protein
MHEEHAHIRQLRSDLTQGKLSRRAFLRLATLLGLAAPAAYALAGAAAQAEASAPTRRDLPRGGHLRIGMAVQDIEWPHRYQWWEHNITRNVCEYLTNTGPDNITRPHLLDRWTVSDDLRSWTLHLRRDVTWRSGRPLDADDVIWNIKHVLDDNTGSSVQGLMRNYMLSEYEAGGRRRTRLWDANAIERIDDHTLRLNCRIPQLAVPEHLFHYPFLILDPEEGGRFRTRSNGTGAFDLVEHVKGKRALLAARSDYWGEGPFLETLEFIDLGDDPAAAVSALAEGKVHGLHFVDDVQLEAVKFLPHFQHYSVVTADTAVARGKVTRKPFDDPRVRRAMRLAVDPEMTQHLILGDRGLPAEHHHVCPIHADYAEIPTMRRDVAAAKALLAEAGYPDGVDLGTIDCKATPSWEFTTVQALADQWRQAGMRCRINLMPASTYWTVWDKTDFGFTEWAHRPLGVMALGLAYRSGVSWNESGYSNPEFDRLLDEAEGILDTEKRSEVIREIEMLMQEDGPIVQPLWRSVGTVMHERVRGFHMHPTRYIFGNELALAPAP